MFSSLLLFIYYFWGVDFKLNFPIQPLDKKISYRHKILLAGSCFAENIGAMMDKYAFHAHTNPNGITYNPHSIAVMLQRLMAGNAYTEDDLFLYNELWSSWQHHGSFSNTDKINCLERINKEFVQAQNYLQNGDWLVITFGSAYVYNLKSTGEKVANCHKFPNKEFDKILLQPADIIAQWQQAIQQLQTYNPQLNILLTVSPVRYVRDGLVNNTLSKAILLQAVHSLCNRFENVNYFPAYELVMDDLRDYRFFTEDLVHPNAQAIQYVWEKLIDSAFDDETQSVYPQIKQLYTERQHRPFNTDTQAYQKFLAAHTSKIQKLKTEYPFIDWKNFLD